MYFQKKMLVLTQDIYDTATKTDAYIQLIGIGHLLLWTIWHVSWK